MDEKIIENFSKLSREDQKIVLLGFVKQLYFLEKKSVTQKDLEKFHVSEWDIQVLFGSLRELRSLAGVPTKYRKANMTDDELRAYIKSIRQNANSCPSYQKVGTVCYSKCECWVAEDISKSRDGRPVIKHKGKNYLLARLSYMMFVKAPQPDMDILHKCDNVGCFNPDHLMEGTAKDNAGHIVERGRRKAETKPRNPRHNIKDPYDYPAILAWVKLHSIVNERGEWIYNINVGFGGYPRIFIAKKEYYLHKLILANKLGVKYEETGIACHRLPATSPFAGEQPSTNNVNPDHIYNGTAVSNANDAKGYRKTNGLSLEDVQFILDEVAKIDLLKININDFDIKLAAKFDVSAKTVRKIRLGESYADWNPNSNVFKKLQKQPVVQLSMDGKFIARYESRKEAAITANKSLAAMSNACNGKAEQLAGFIWMDEVDYQKQNESVNENDKSDLI